MKDAKVTVLTRMVELARVIRRRGTPEEAAVILPYEQLLAHDLEIRQAELAQLQRKAVAA